MRFPGEKKSHPSSHSCAPSPSPLECAWHLTHKADYKEGLRSGKHKPETSQSLEGESSQHWGLVTFRAKGITVPYL